MKKAIFLALVLSLFFGPGFVAGQSANGGPVTLNAIIPGGIGFTGPSVQSVTFDYTNLGSALALGVPVSKLASGASPSWSLFYNLSNSPTITVCAYTSDLVGTNNSSNTIPGTAVYSATASSGTTAYQFNGNYCGHSNAIEVDTIANATSSSGTTEALKGMFMQTPDGTVIAPDTYTGTLSIIAIAQ